MAPVVDAEAATATSTRASDRAQWNEAHARLELYLKGFAMQDSFHIARLTLSLLERAKTIQAKDPTRAPVTVTLEEAHHQMSDWLAKSIGANDRLPDNLVASGTLALLINNVPQRAPDTFLAGELSEDLRHSVRETLVHTGPDLNVSSMTPRHLDYGPMLDLARQTWHRWNPRSIVAAFLFWLGVYLIFYSWLSHALK